MFFRVFQAFCVGVATLITFVGQDVCGQQKGEQKGPATQNELLTRFVDNPKEFKGKTLTFLLVYADRPGNRLRDRIEREGVPVDGYTPSGKTKVSFAIKLPSGKDFPDIEAGGQMVVTLECTLGSAFRGNKAITIRRPE